MSEQIEIRFPAQADLLVLGRMTAAAVGVRAGYTVEEVEDLRLAVDELCLWVLATPGGPTVEVRFDRDGTAIDVEARRTGPSHSDLPGVTVAGPDDLPADGITQQELSRQILGALLGDGGAELEDGIGPSRIRMRQSGVEH